jgi:hypothetical protein
LRILAVPLHVSAYEKIFARKTAASHKRILMPHKQSRDTRRSRQQESIYAAELSKDEAKIHENARQRTA